MHAVLGPSGIVCDLTVLWKFKQLHANAVEMPLGVTWALMDILGMSKVLDA